MKKLTSTPTLADIQQAHLAIRPYINKTAVVTSESINTISGANIFFKCENFQKVGAFKMRGATYATLSLTKEEMQNGIATHSSGNHAQAVALSAKKQGIPGYIVMPENSPIIKKNAVIGYGAEVTLCESTQAARESTLEDIVEKTGAAFIHPYDNYNVICGQATASKELYEEVGELDIILSPIGGGGLMCGTALTTHYLFPKTKIIGTEPKEVNDAARSFQSGFLQKNTTTNTIADGLRTNLSSKTFGIIQQYVHEIITVEESEIVEAMRLIWERMKIIVEPSAAVPFAAVLKRKDFFKGKKIGIIISGGNVDVGDLPF